MAKTSATAGVNRAFSGPPPSAADARSVGNDEASFSLETARAALLQLRDSITSVEFQKPIEGMTDAGTTEAKEYDTASKRPETVQRTRLHLAEVPSES